MPNIPGHRDQYSGRRTAPSSLQAIPAEGRANGVVSTQEFPTVSHSLAHYSMPAGWSGQEGCSSGV